MKWTATAVLLVLVGQVAVADDPTLCEDPITTTEVGACTEAKLANADAELNRVYAALLDKEKGNPVFVEKIRKAQLAWIAFRDAELEAMYACAEEGGPSACWGSIYKVCRPSAELKLTEERTKRLKQYFDEGRTYPKFCV